MDLTKPQVTRPWEFDSLLELPAINGGKVIKQVWSRPSAQWPDTRDWTLMVATPGRENPPKPTEGHWTSTEAFRKAHPHFRPQGPSDSTPGQGG